MQLSKASQEDEYELQEGTFPLCQTESNLEGSKDSYFHKQKAERKLRSLFVSLASVRMVSVRCFCHPFARLPKRSGSSGGIRPFVSFAKSMQQGGHSWLGMGEKGSNQACLSKKALNGRHLATWRSSSQLLTVLSVLLCLAGVGVGSCLFGPTVLESRG